MRSAKRNASGPAAWVLVALGAGLAGEATAQTTPMLAIEREPPTATRPVFTPPVMVPPAMPGAAPTISGPPVPAQPIIVPPGPGPVAMPEVPKPSAPLAPLPVASPPAAQHPIVPAPQPAPVTPPPAPAEPAPVTPAPAEPAPVVTTPPVPTPPPAATVEPTAPTAAPAPAPAAAPPTPPAADAAPASPPPGAVTPPATPPVVAAPPVPQPPVKLQLVPVEVEVTPRPVLYVTGRTTWEAAEEKLGGAFTLLSDAARKSGAKGVGAPLVEYIETDAEDVGYRAMLPVEALPKGKLPKTVKTGQSPGGKALKFRHNGPLDDLEEVYARIDDELAKRSIDTKSIVEEYDEDALASPEDRVVMDIYVFPK